MIIINGLSKGFAMTGWRLGYIAANADVAKACEKLQGQFTSGTNSITQKAAVVALTADLRPSFEMVENLRGGRKRTMELVKEIPGIKCFEPQGLSTSFLISLHILAKVTEPQRPEFCRLLYVPVERGERFIRDG